MDHYQQVRRELDRLGPALGEPFAADDKLLWEAETHFPGGQIQALSREVEACLNSFGTLSKMEQYAQLKIWIGRFRLYQAGGDDGAAEESPPPAQAQRVFHQLKTLSKQYEPGYIEAFRHDYTTDWSAYIAEAQEQLLQAIETARRPRDKDKDRDHEHPRPPRDPGRSYDEALDDPPPAAHDDLLSVTHGRRALMIGGSVREDVRRNLLRLFDFDRIDWEPSGDAGPGLLDTIERRICDRSVDLVLILQGFVGDHVSDRLRPLCEQHGIPCLLVEHGPGPAQVGEALRRGLPRSA
jgi:hypothetical protein